jgi:hypothetical protein
MGSKMKITRRQLRRIIKEAIGATTAKAFADKHGLQLELDNEGQKIIYLSNKQADHLDMPLGANWEADRHEDGWVIYTGEYQ